MTVVHNIILQGFVSYQLSGGNLSWSSTFREIESNKERLGIVDYSVSQTTLDQVRKLEEWISKCPKLTCEALRSMQNPQHTARNIISGYY